MIQRRYLSQDSPNLLQMLFPGGINTDYTVGGTGGRSALPVNVTVKVHPDTVRDIKNIVLIAGGTIGAGITAAAVLKYLRS